jgi:DHA2 family multidrug resistance protein
VAVASTILGAFMAILDIQITNSSLADIQGAVGASTEEGSWISTGYLMAEIIVIPITGWLGHVFTLRRYLVANSILFLIFSVACALSTSLPELILFRIGQGFTGGVLIPTAIITVRTRLPRNKQPIGIALFGLVATFAPSIGPTLGGWLTDNFGWQYLFYLNIIPGCIAIATQLYSLPTEPMHLEELVQGDWFGIITMGVGLSSLTYILEEGQRKEWYDSPIIAQLSVLSFVMIVTFLIIEFTSKRPFINLRLLGNHAVGGSCFLMSVVGAVMYGTVYLIPVYLSQVQGYNAQQIGMVVMWNGVPQLLIFPFVPWLLKRFDLRYLITTGMILTAISCFITTNMTHDTGNLQLILPQVMRAIGQPLFIIPLSQLSTAGLSLRNTADASSLSNVTRNLGGSIGIALLSTMIQRREQFHFSAIAGNMTQNNSAVQDRLSHMSGSFIARGGDVALAKMQAMGQLAAQVRREAMVMAFSDAFFVLGCFIVGSMVMVLILPKTSSKGDIEVH